MAVAVGLDKRPFSNEDGWAPSVGLMNGPWLEESDRSPKSKKLSPRLWPGELRDTASSFQISIVENSDPRRIRRLVPLPLPLPEPEPLLRPLGLVLPWPLLEGPAPGLRPKSWDGDAESAMGASVATERPPGAAASASGRVSSRNRSLCGMGISWARDGQAVVELVLAVALCGLEVLPSGARSEIVGGDRFTMGEAGGVRKAGRRLGVKME